MCAGHIIDEVVMAILARVKIGAGNLAPRGRNAQRSDAGRVSSGDSFHRWSFEGRPG